MTTHIEPAALVRMSVDEVTARLAAIVEPGSVIAFDADGTLWSGDIGMETFQVVLARRLLREESQEELAREAAAFGLACVGDPNEQGRVLYEAFEAGTYPEDRAFAMMAWSLAGHTLEQARALAAALVEEADLRSRLLPEAIAVLNWAHGRAVPVAVVSASPALVIEAALAQLELPVSHVFGMRPAVRGSRLVAALRGPATYGPGKAETLKSELPGARLSAAFGDSAFDLPMLREATLAVAVRPKMELVARRHECPGLVELVPIGRA